MSQQYTCLVCGYVYDPAHGDPGRGIELGTSFDDLPDDWECPVCEAPVMDFQEIPSTKDAPIAEVEEVVNDDEEIPENNEE